MYGNRGQRQELAGLQKAYAACAAGKKAALLCRRVVSDATKSVLVLAGEIPS